MTDELRETCKKNDDKKNLNVDEVYLHQSL